MMLSIFFDNEKKICFVTYIHEPTFTNLHSQTYIHKPIFTNLHSQTYIHKPTFINLHS